jgi:hypothetical protein
MRGLSTLPTIAAVPAISSAPATTAMPPAPTTTATVATTSAAVSATTTTPATTAATALCLGPRFVHNEVSPAEILTVQRVDRSIRVFVAIHLDEGEAARLSGETIADQIDT